MTPFLYGLARAVVDSFALPEPILEVGSYQVMGQEAIADLRGLFPGREYYGLDMRPGPGVDLVEDVQRLSLPDESVGTVLALSTFEHVGRFWRGFDEVFRVLRPDGAFFVCCPFYFHIHDYPGDYWRFTPQALSLLLERYPSKLIGWQGPRTRPANVWAVAFREEHPTICPDEFERYRQRMNAWACEPLSLFRKVRYLLGRLLCGRRPFAPYLDRQLWEAHYENDPVPRGQRGGALHDPDRVTETPAVRPGPRRADRAGRLGVHR
jgi:hypothetical protein